MSQGRSRADLLKFLDWMGEKGLIPANTAASRKAAANKVLALLSDEEAEDVTGVDADDLIRRFGNKFGQQYSPDSLMSYRSRLRTATEDFRAYCESPVGFRPAGRVQQQRSQNSKEGSSSTKTSTIRPEVAPHRPSPAAPSVHVLPIAIRADVTVQVGNLPFDLTEAEAQRIANVILAYAVPAV